MTNIYLDPPPVPPRGTYAVLMAGALLLTVGLGVGGVVGFAIGLAQSEPPVVASQGAVLRKWEVRVSGPGCDRDLRLVEARR